MRLTFKQGIEVLQNAQNYIKENNVWRLGQALWIHLPADITDEHRGSDADFFNWTDNERVLRVFFSNFYII